jgi:membrane-bound serine protease (ClpP class)
VKTPTARALSLVACALLGLCSTGALAATHVNLATIDGSINPASADYLIRSIEQSEQDGAAALLIELDTPGGLVASTKNILEAILNSRVPVIVYVAPSGAWASSAGTYITVAAHIAAMAPGTSIGAASPVSAGGGGGRAPAPGGGDEPAPREDVGMEKAEKFLAAYLESIARVRKRNVEWVVKAVREAEAIGENKALELNVIDVVAPSRESLFEAIEGRTVELAGGEERTLELAGAGVVPIQMSALQRLFDFLADPNVAVVLFLAGLLGIYVEVNNPGLIVPGVAGAICLVLTAIAFQILPFDWVGLLLVMAGIGLLVAEVFVASFGALFAAGILCLLLGGSMLFERPELSDLTVSFWSVLVPAVAAVAIFGGLVVFAIGRTLGLAQASGEGELVGLVGRSVSRLAPVGKIFVRGESWTAHSEGGEIAEGESVEVTAVDGMRLRVRRAAERS